MRKFLKAVLIIVLCITIPLGLLAGYGQYTWWKYMQPYRQIVEQHRSEKEVRRIIGEPNFTISDDVGLKKWIHDRPPHSKLSDRLENKIYVYYADPFNDGEGSVVYIVFDKDGIAEIAMPGG